jgi:hypothetical protein
MNQHLEFDFTCLFPHLWIDAYLLCPITIDQLYRKKEKAEPIGPAFPVNKFLVFPVTF